MQTSNPTGQLECCLSTYSYPDPDPAWNVFLNKIRKKRLSSDLAAPSSSPPPPSAAANSIRTRMSIRRAPGCHIHAIHEDNATSTTSGRETQREVRSTMMQPHSFMLRRILALRGWIIRERERERERHAILRAQAGEGYPLSQLTSERGQKWDGESVSLHTERKTWKSDYFRDRITCCIQAPVLGKS